MNEQLIAHGPSDIQMTYEYTWMTYEWHTSDRQVHANDIQMTYKWHVK